MKERKQRGAGRPPEILKIEDDPEDALARLLRKPPEPKGETEDRDGDQDARRDQS